MEDRCFFMEEWECLEGLGWVWVVYRLEIYFILFNINNFNNSCIFKDVLDKCRLWRVWWEGRVSVDSIWVWCLICSGYSYYIMLLYYELLILGSIGWVFSLWVIYVYFRFFRYFYFFMRRYLFFMRLYGWFKVVYGW